MTEASRPSWSIPPSRASRNGGRRSQAISRVREDLQGKRGVSKLRRAAEGDGARVLSDQSTYQTFEFVRQKKKQFSLAESEEHDAWEALEYLNTLVDDSDPDTDLSQLQHLLQTAEAIRADGHPDWFVLTGLLHDLGKVLCLFASPMGGRRGHIPGRMRLLRQSGVPEYFQQNPDTRNPAYRTRLGVYQEGCGLDKVHLSWGHDEYIYNVVKVTCRKRGSTCCATTRSTRHTGRGVRIPDERARQADVRVGAPVQPLRSLFEESHSSDPVALRPTTMH